MKYIFLVVMVIVGVLLVSGCTTTQNNTSSSGANGIEIVISYSGPWNGTIDYGEGLKPVAGNDSQTIKINGTPKRVTADINKLDSSNNILKVEILQNGKIKKNMTISGPNGGVMVSELFS
jgi:uncharacterized protein YceK